MTAKEVSELLAKHLQTPLNFRDPKESETLMGWALVNLNRSRLLIKDTLIPATYTPPGAVNIEHEKKLSDYLK